MSDRFAITTAEQLAAAYGAPHPRFLAKVTDRLEATSRAFIAAAPFCILATAGLAASLLVREPSGKQAAVVG